MLPVGEPQLALFKYKRLAYRCPLGAWFAIYLCNLGIKGMVHTVLATFPDFCFFGGCAERTKQKKLSTTRVRHTLYTVNQVLISPINSRETVFGHTPELSKNCGERIKLIGSRIRELQPFKIRIL
jgi:hypothetical protein